MNWNHQLQYNINLEVSLEKTLLTLTASRDGWKNLWKPEEHLARNWVSPWHIESNKWSTCWSLSIAWKSKFLKYGYYLNYSKFFNLNFNKQTSLCKKLYHFIYFSYFAITFWNVCRSLWTPCTSSQMKNVDQLIKCSKQIPAHDGNDDRFCTLNLQVKVTHL